MSQTRLLLTLPDARSARRARHLLRSQVSGCEVLDEPRNCSQAALCRWLQELPAQQAGQVHAELSAAIAVLENSRHAFKSAPLAQLRKRLSQVREELLGPNNSGKT